MIQFPFWAHYAKMILILGKKLKWKVSIATLKFVRLKFTCIWYWERLDNYISSVIRQKGESQNGCFKKTKHAKFSEKQTFLTPDMHTCTCDYQGVRIVRFSENLACIVFLKHPFWDSPFCHITDNLAAC